MVIKKRQTSSLDFIVMRFAIAENRFVTLSLQPHCIANSGGLTLLLQLQINISFGFGLECVTRNKMNNACFVIV
ncbi:MAG: hypothetical protein JWQ09_2041 [Segetibacter sp.]|nr:hypothetical protein [Segetibacter sp.]